MVLGGGGQGLMLVIKEGGAVGFMPYFGEPNFRLLLG